jgi:hypothetical protein
MWKYKSAKQLAAHWFLAQLIFEPEDESDTFLRNVGSQTGRYILECGNI